MAVLSRLRGLVNTVRILPKALAQARAGSIRRRVIQPARLHAYRAMRTGFGMLLDQIDRWWGHEAGNRIFWKFPVIQKSWEMVSERMLRLAGDAPGALPHFVRQSYLHTRNPLLLVNLARSVLSKEVLRDCLADEDLSPGAPIHDRVRSSRAFGAGLVATAALVLDEDASAGFAAALQPSVPMSESFFELIDSFGTRPVQAFAADLRSGLNKSGFRKPTVHRLVIATAVRHDAEIVPLFAGAQKVTLLVMNDLYGRASFDAMMAHAGDCTVTVENPRSRISRFSADYHRIHEDTRAAAEVLIDGLATGPASDLVKGDLAAAKLALADNLFFPALRLEAMKKLLQSDEFDHVVIALEGETQGANDWLLRIIGEVPGASEDPRLELVSSSPRQGPRQQFSRGLSVLQDPSLPVRKGQPRPKFAGLLEQQDKVKNFARQFTPWPEQPGRDRVLLALTQVGAYNRSSAAICSTLDDASNLRLLFLGGNLLAFSNSIEDGIDPKKILAVPFGGTLNLPMLEHWLTNEVEALLDKVAAPYVAGMIAERMTDVVRNGILGFQTHQQMIRDWFGWMREANQLPKAVVLTPFRNARVATLASVARDFGVPSVAVEPHGLNASYCRYVQVTADYYGVVSKFFVREAVNGFGMSADRCPVVGSPRLIAPADYDRAAATRAARAAIMAENDVDLDAPRAVFSYFCQPSEWGQVAEVWSQILEATDGLDVLLILKTHPEETPSRINAYLDIARNLGASDRVVQIEADAVATIEASDVVLSGYSATILEAALFRRPVFAVTNGDVDYPLAQHDVVGCPLLRSTEELRAQLENFLADPEPYNIAAAEFVKNEPQFIEGFETHLMAFLDDLLSRPAEDAVRPVEEVPDTLFIKGPHTVYRI